MAKLTGWIGIKKRPVYRGNYRVKLHDGSVVMARFKGRNWYSVESAEMHDVTLLCAWQGRCGLIEGNLVEASVNSMEVNHRRKDVRPLFRHWVSSGDGPQACRSYLIGKVLGVKFTMSEKRAYQELTNSLSVSVLKKVKKSVDRFFGQVV